MVDTRRIIREQAETLVARLLQEAPRDITATDFGMSDAARRVQFVSKLKRDKRARVIDHFGGLALVKVGRTIYVENEEGLTYFVQWADRKYAALPGRHCTQIAVWRRAGTIPGLASRVFWQHLFPIHGTLMTDATQTTDGKNFWADRVQDALRQKLYVYRVNLVQHLVTPVKSMPEYEQWRVKMYGQEKKYELENLVITDKPVEEKPPATT